MLLQTKLQLSLIHIFFIDFVAPDTRINDIQLGVPVSINIENGVAAMALAHLSGATDEEIKHGMASFRGVDRRFDFKLKNDRIVVLDVYKRQHRYTTTSALP